MVKSRISIILKIISQWMIVPCKDRANEIIKVRVRKIFLSRLIKVIKVKSKQILAHQVEKKQKDSTCTEK